MNNSMDIYRVRLTDESIFHAVIPSSVAGCWGKTEREEVDEIVEWTIELFPPDRIPLPIYLFGSFAYGVPNDRSDYDVCLATPKFFVDGVNGFTSKILLRRIRDPKDKKRRGEIIVLDDERLKNGLGAVCADDIFRKGILLYRGGY